jgi:tetratricopeptide (TPR) repeat protein
MRSSEFWQWFDDYAAPKLSSWKSKGMSRDQTFRAMFEHLDSFTEDVIIVETGCIEDPDNWAGNGCSTILFDKYIETHPGSRAVSIEIDAEKVKRARSICHNVDIFTGDSVKVLKELSEPRPGHIDLLYLDASHHDWFHEVPTQVHHYNELMAAMPALHSYSLVAVDDSIACFDDYPQAKITGKGGLVAQYAFEVGAEMEFCEYQIGFTGITNNAPGREDIEHLVERARALIERGKNEAADRIYYLILILTPPPWSGPNRIARGEACANFARRAHRLRRYGAAIEWFGKALYIDPIASDYRCEMIFSLVALGSLDMARREANIAIAIEPDYPRNWQTLGGVESDRLNVEATIAAYDKQIETALKLPEGNEIALADAYQNRAVIAIDTADYELVRLMCRNILDLKVRAGDAYHLLAMIENRLSNHEKAVEYFDRALQAECRNQPLCHWNKALSLEAIGRLKDAGDEKSWNEKEMTVPAIYIPQKRFMVTKWKGESAQFIDVVPINGKLVKSITEMRRAVIHVHHEAGFGDNISMWRYFPLLIERGFEVQYETDEPLISLVRRNFPDVLVMPMAKDYPGIVGLKQPFDYHMPIGDLPHAFGTDIDTIPWRGPYLKADPNKSAVFADELKQFDGRKIGLCWSSGIRKNASIWMERYGKMKSMHFADLHPLINNDDMFISLQVGDGRDEFDWQVHDLLSDKPDWEETAALIDNLDLVITVDTGVAHLAGAMGRPCWVMMQRDGASWHFMCWREGASWNEASPWYPSVRIFRQHEFNRPGYWKDVVDDVSRALNNATGNLEQRDRRILRQ